MNKLIALKNRFFLFIILAMLGFGFIVGGSLLDDQNLIIIRNILMTIGTGLLSASITIYLIKYDIMSIIQKNNVDDYGVNHICQGRDYIFNDEYCSKLLKVNNWSEFLASSSTKEIDIVGIAMYSFIVNYHLIDQLVILAKRGYRINLVFGNPESNEVFIQSTEENKPGALKNHIELVVRQICDAISESDEAFISTVKENLKVHYSQSLPKAFIVRSGKKMVITPYLLSGPFKVPTMIVHEHGEMTYFDTYKHYIDKLIKSGEEVCG